MLDGYLRILRRVLDEGARAKNRTGVDTLKLPSQDYTVDLEGGAKFPLLTERRVPWKNVVAELIWYLRGDTNIEFLRKHRVPIWDTWADANGEVAAGYGKHFRRYATPAGPVDQVALLIEGLKSNPYSRRHVVDAWHPSEARVANPPPCVTTQTYTVMPPSGPWPEPRLHLHLLQRSGDLGIGVPHNIACYALMLQLLCRFTGLRPGTIKHTIVDAHLYVQGLDGSNAEYCHVAGVSEVLRRRGPFDRPPRTNPPRLHLSPAITTLDGFVEWGSGASTAELVQGVAVHNYAPGPTIRMKAAP